MVSFSRFYCIICLFLSIHIRRRIFGITLSFDCITIMYIPVRDGQEHWHLPYLVGRPGSLVTARWLSVFQSVEGLLLSVWSSCATLWDALFTRPLYLYNYSFCWYQCMCQSAITHLTCTVYLVQLLCNQRITIIWVISLVITLLNSTRCQPLNFHPLLSIKSPPAMCLVEGGILQKNIIVRLSSFTKKH